MAEQVPISYTNSKLDWMIYWTTTVDALIKASTELSLYKAQCKRTGYWTSL